MNGNMFWRIDSDSNLVAFDLHHVNPDVIINGNLLADFS